MNLAILTTYPPRECGIASFSKDLRDNLVMWDQNVKILAVSDKNSSYKYPPEVVFELCEDKKDDYHLAAEFVNTADLDAVFVEHEYGIFGGNDGSFVLDFVVNLEKPFILNTHTVLPAPGFRQRGILSRLGQKATAVICMTRRSAELLNRVYRVPMEKIYVVPHGVPIFKEKPREALKKAYGIAGRPLVTTFGFIGPGKGIELGIKAISYLREKYPDIVYLVAGETHPNLMKKMGEVYRESLVELIETLRLEENIRFINRYISLDELGEILFMTDVYLTPYPHRNQAVSGTLSYAIGCGRAIVSTPYDYSLEVLSDGRGLVASEANPEKIASLIDSILSNPQLKSQLEKRAAKLGRTMFWPEVARSYVNILENILQIKASRKVF
ncbi:glycosyltransferase family 4 protein [Thermoanaerobacterium sp. DL9XJH110]|uniref:glycosyltransferase family 4 protein n=1 Tax=Thermoanaerobacterium sp. DL9XJH110 TaxID=3386643 RepID=UPI003BB7C928